jgi:hypothetical protein
MIRLIILAAIGIAIGLLISKLFSKKSDDDVIDGEVVDADPVPRKPSLLPVLLLWRGNSWCCSLCIAAIWYQRDGFASKATGISAIDQRFSTLLTVHRHLFAFF